MDHGQGGAGQTADQATVWDLKGRASPASHCFQHAAGLVLVCYISNSSCNVPVWTCWCFWCQLIAIFVCFGMGRAGAKSRATVTVGPILASSSSDVRVTVCHSHIPKMYSCFWWLWITVLTVPVNLSANLVHWIMSNIYIYIYVCMYTQKYIYIQLQLYTHPVIEHTDLHTFFSSFLFLFLWFQKAHWVGRTRGKSWPTAGPTLASSSSDVCVCARHSPSQSYSLNVQLFLMIMDYCPDCTSDS